MTDKFTKNTEDTKGILRLDFGEFNETVVWKSAHIAYVNNNCMIEFQLNCPKKNGQRW